MTKSSKMHLEEIEFLFPNMHITRSSIKRNDLVPLHVHGNKYGFVYVLSGRCRITNYSVVHQENSLYTLELIADKEYQDDEYTIVTKKNNVHSILALEDTTFLDAFTVGFPDETIQQFLKIVDDSRQDSFITARTIELSEANIPNHLLEKVCKEVKIN